MRPLLDAEWGAYSQAALSQFASQRSDHEAALQAAGHSAWFNSRVRGGEGGIRGRSTMNL